MGKNAPNPLQKRTKPGEVKKGRYDGQEWVCFVCTHNVLVQQHEGPATTRKRTFTRNMVNGIAMDTLPLLNRYAVYIIFNRQRPKAGTIRSEDKRLPNRIQQHPKLTQQHHDVPTPICHRSLRPCHPLLRRDPLYTAGPLQLRSQQHLLRNPPGRHQSRAHASILRPLRSCTNEDDARHSPPLNKGSSHGP